MKNTNEGILQSSLADKIRNSLELASIHVVCIFAIWTGITWRALGIAFVLYWARMFLITGGYHRYFAHRSYKTSRVFQFVLAFFGTTAMQKGPLWWTSRHRIHHQYSDKPLDVHSPKIYGWWQAHIGWLFLNNHSSADPHYVKDLAKFPELVWLEKYHWVAPIILTALCWYLAGWSGVVVGMGWSTVVFWHAVFSINSLAHLWGSRRYQTGDDSRNNFLLAMIVMGEGWHNNHHHCPHSVNQGFKWWEIDATYYILRLLALVGLIWELKKPSQSELLPTSANTTTRLTLVP